MKLAVIIGHTKKAKGAYSEFLKISEYDWNLEFSRILVMAGLENGVECFVKTRDLGGIAGAYQRAVKKKPAAIVELHLNAFNGKASGTETLYADSPGEQGNREVLLAKAINDAMVKALRLPNRGIKKRMPGDRGYGNLIQTKIPSILIEPFFCDNKKDCKAAEANKEKLALAIIGAFKNWAKI